MQLLAINILLNRGIFFAELGSLACRDPSLIFLQLPGWEKTSGAVRAPPRYKGGAADLLVLPLQDDGGG